jgi:hypothetical protein
LSELTSELFRRLLAGELEAAVVLLPEGKTAPPPLLTNIIASDRMEIVQGAAGNVAVIGKVWAEHPGCSIRPGARFGQASSIGWSVTASPQ